MFATPCMQALANDIACTSTCAGGVNSILLSLAMTVGDVYMLEIPL